MAPKTTPADSGPIEEIEGAVAAASDPVKPALQPEVTGHIISRSQASQYFVYGSDRTRVSPRGRSEELVKRMISFPLPVGLVFVETKTS